MDKIIVTAKTYDEAVTKALIELGTTQDNLEIKVIENGTNGLFGIFGAKPCKIEASIIKRVDDFELLKRENKLHSEQLIHALNARPEGKKDSRKETGNTPDGKENSTSEREPKFEKAQPRKLVLDSDIASHSETQAPAKADAEIKSEQEILPNQDNEQEDRFTGMVPLSEEEATAIVASAEGFVQKLLTTMEFDVQVSSSFDHNTNEVYMLLNSEQDMGIIIGKRGQTLDSIQYITSLVVNKNTSQYIRVKLDAQGYRGKRKDKLEALANSVAVKVKRFKKPISLEPMNPYERRIIHSALQSHPYITTKSEGEEPNRFITILPKNSFSKSRFNKNPKFRKNNDRGGYRGQRDFDENRKS